ncbi:hypothetical protein THRCLA_01425 [Thraustotheca clavata]|uniref:Peptidase S54 rhomboid domain-containing protein n=1 Tax=Thraustotheca clavata TaxID=74557 RepID=A0A1W0A8H9_9STRA|nr:hypothetical protein THRCLA_01425 [Thraustotheca clavata]
MIFSSPKKYTQQLERKPPVTLALMGGMAGLFLYRDMPGMPTARKYALCPAEIVRQKSLSRLVVSAFLHGDEWHLYNNLASLLWKGVQLELSLGSQRFLQMVGILLILSHSIDVGASYALSIYMNSNQPIRQCSIGFSAVLFALKIVLNYNSPSHTSIMGIIVPTRYVAWLELVYLHYFVPQSSFVGHLSGILAGYIYMKSPLWNINLFSPSPRYSYRIGSTGYRQTNTSSRRAMEEADAAYARRLQEEEYRRLIMEEATTKAVVQVEKNMLSRLLYPNPVCLLTVQEALNHEILRNVMTITWLTPINNHGKFVCSMNCKRHTAHFVNTPGKHFVINIPTKNHEEKILAIGGCSGESVDKFEALNLATCPPGWTALRPLKRKNCMSKKDLREAEIHEAVSNCIALDDCIAHIVCKVDTVAEVDGHYLLTCTQVAAWTLSNYWNGKHFAPRSPSDAPYLTFLGTKVFASITPTFD